MVVDFNKTFIVNGWIVLATQVVDDHPPVVTTVEDERSLPRPPRLANSLRSSINR